jgi:hypothetical protein
MVEPSLGDDRIVVEQHEVLAAGDLQSLVDRGGKVGWAAGEFSAYAGVRKTVMRRQ